MPAKLPLELFARLSNQFGSTTAREIEQACGRNRLPTFRVNTLKATDEEVMSILRDQAIAFERVKAIPHAFKAKNRSDRELLELPLAKEGKIYLQNLSSMLPPIILDPQPGEVILDMCAAPGSKTTQLAALCLTTPSPSLHKEGTHSVSPLLKGELEGVNPCRILAVEEDSIRYQKLTNTVLTQGASTVETRHGDSTQLHKEFPEAFDKILADVPCSAEGRIDLNDPRSYKYWSEKNIVAHAKLQRRLLRSAVACLKPGGVLVYSTCTLAPEENEKMIEWLVTEFPTMKPVEVTVPLKGFRKTALKTITVLPTDEAEGFFVAKLQKN